MRLLALLSILSLLLFSPAQVGLAQEPEDTLQSAPLVPEERAELDRSSQEELDVLLSRVPGLDDVQVRIEAGVAFLSGTVLSQEDRELAHSLAQTTPGIVYIDNRIQESTSLGSRVRDLRDRSRERILLGLAYVPILLLAGLLVALFFVVGGLVARWDWPFLWMSKNPFLRTLLQQLSGGAVGIAGLLLALELLDATALVGAVLGAAGVAGIAVGFAFRNIAENYLAGILLSLRQPFSPNDHVLLEGQEGKVVRLTSRETILMTLDGNHVRIPNAMVFNSILLNFTRNPLRRFRFDLTVGQDQDLVRSQELGLSALEDLPGVLSDPPPRVVVQEVGDSWVLLRFFGWANQATTSFEKVRSEAIRAVKDALDQGGIDMPAPEYRLSFSGSPPKELPVGREPDGGRGPWAPPAPTSPSDISPDRELDEQIAKDRVEAGEKDLLAPEAPHSQGNQPGSPSE